MLLKPLLYPPTSTTEEPGPDGDAAWLVSNCSRLGSCALPTHRELPFVYKWGVLRTPLFYQIKSLCNCTSAAPKPLVPQSNVPQLARSVFCQVRMISWTEISEPIERAWGLKGGHCRGSRLLTFEFGPREGIRGAMSVRGEQSSFCLTDREKFGDAQADKWARKSILMDGHGQPSEAGNATNRPELTLRGTSILIGLAVRVVRKIGASGEHRAKFSDETGSSAVRLCDSTL